MSIGIWNVQDWDLTDKYSKSKKKTVEAIGFMRGHEASIEDLCMLNNGILLSCAYDKLVIAWRYHKEEEVCRYVKDKELRCMDYIENQGKLFVGTNAVVGSNEA